MSEGLTTRPALRGARVELRALVENDYAGWLEVWQRNRHRLDPVGAFPVDPADGRWTPELFQEKLAIQDATHRFALAAAFAIWCDGDVAGEIALNGNLQPDGSALLSAWVDVRRAGQRLVEEAFVLLVQHGFEQMGIHRIECAVLPDNAPVRRALELVELRNEGLAQRYLKIGDTWRDHLRYAITAEEWVTRKRDLLDQWVLPQR